MGEFFERGENLKLSESLPNLNLVKLISLLLLVIFPHSMLLYYLLPILLFLPVPFPQGRHPRGRGSA